MNLKKALFIISAALVAATSTAADNYKAVSADIAQYVYPKNRSQTPPSFQYAPDGNGYLMLSADGTTIDRYDTKTGNKIETVFDVNHTRETTLKSIEGFTMSKNSKYILVHCDSEPIYRRSTMASYYVYELYSRLLRPLSNDFKKQRSPIISDNGRMVAFVGPDNNIYIKKNDYNSQVAVTKDGAPGKIINGVPDWVYEEEFATTCSMAWSPDDLTLCFLRYDETEVPLYTLPVYEGTCHPDSRYALYPGTYTYKYPVAGAPNSKVTVHSYDVDNRKTKQIQLADNSIEYIPRIDFGPDADCLLISTLNRDQNRYEIYAANPRSTIAKSIYVDKSDAWIEECAYTGLTLLPDGFVVMSTRTGYNHLYHYTYAGALKKTLTKGEFDVTDFCGTDAKGNIYYQAAAPTPLDRVIYRIDAKGVTTAVSATSGANTATFSPDMSIAMMMHSDTKTPPVYTLNTPDGKVLRTLVDNKADAKRYANLPSKEFFTFTTADGVKLNGYVIRPEGEGKHPVIMSQYSGPGSQQVLNRWSVDWEQYFAMKGYVIVCVDGRGTGGRGRAFMDVVYKNLGHYETIDQIAAARYAASLPYADASRIGIYGWSYGGYEALMAASADNSPYAAAVAIAPVTDWRYYDSVYAERFMLTPQQNEKGYRASAPINFTSRLSCPLLMMYGTSDDNVHPMNTLQYVSTLQSQGRICDMFIFPNMNHSIYGCGARAVVYTRMLQFFDQNLK